jgi:predicted O-methyltransferase YrrM
LLNIDEICKEFKKKMKKYKHYYHVLEGFSEDIVDFYKIIIQQAQSGQHFVEVGGYKGKSTAFMAVEILNSEKIIKFDCVDTWEGSPEMKRGGEFQDHDVVNNTLYEKFLYNIQPVKKIVNPVRHTSVDAAKLYEDNSLDFVFIDADHSYESTREDIDAWLPKIKNGGIISGHDYSKNWPGVVRAVNETFDDIRLYQTCWMVQV